jgi:hypothetical protein
LVHVPFSDTSQVLNVGTSLYHSKDGKENS